mgnify:CR=1 FL=1
MRGRTGSRTPSSSRVQVSLLVGVALVSAGLATTTSGEDIGTFRAESFGRTVAEAAETTPRFLDGQAVLAPIPFVNPTLESGLGLAAAYLFTTDPAAETSYVGIGGFRATNGSRGAGFALSLSLAEDRWRAFALVGAADVRYDVAALGREFPISQDGWATRIDLRRRIRDRVFVGGQVRYLDVSTGLRRGDRPFGERVAGAGVDVTAGLVGPSFEADFRDDSINPRRGWRLNAVALQSFAEPFDRVGWFEYGKGTVLLDGFVPVVDDATLALRLAGCHVRGEAPFFDLCALGGDDAFRGYAVGRFLGDSLLSAQAEYRGRLTGRWGWTTFAGVGHVGTPLDRGTPDLLPAVGAGLRFRLSEEFGLDFSTDIAVGTEGPALYVYLGQNF